MKIELKLGAVTVKEFAEIINGRLYTLSESAPFNEIELFTDEIGDGSGKERGVLRNMHKSP